MGHGAAATDAPNNKSIASEVRPPATVSADERCSHDRASDAAARAARALFRAAPPAVGLLRQGRVADRRVHRDCAGGRAARQADARAGGARAAAVHDAHAAAPVVQRRRVAEGLARAGVRADGPVRAHQLRADGGLRVRVPRARRGVLPRRARLRGVRRERRARPGARELPRRGRREAPRGGAAADARRLARLGEVLLLDSLSAAPRIRRHRRLPLARGARVEPLGAAKAAEPAAAEGAAAEGAADVDGSVAAARRRWRRRRSHLRRGLRPSSSATAPRRRAVRPTAARRRRGGGGRVRGARAGWTFTPITRACRRT